ncbi:6-acetamido-3-oxohexanoate:acetyl-CoA CoA transferase alpha subunit [Fictibacillus enclensis]|uniref:CoA-transferase n=1 Tax=Fictibacillus enclensis TaxID=1017270 RepID=A0A0V8JEA7_9BACL|nr:CoA transferase subunit A [Fictibacillus enclensis]KSU85245.1 CoA-transferase [Fictibacillus enclensis]SCB93619.1 6-acetamido-3-oxohexanoate:acetyl-CoA CoA transferase alpha subunit [Fictibacillus enclensis]
MVYQSTEGSSKTKQISIEEAATHFFNGMTLMVGGFGGVGAPPGLINVLIDKQIKDIYMISNDTGFPWIGPGKLITEKRVSRLIASHIGSNPEAGKQMQNGELEVEFIPQGTLAEKIRAGGMGLGGILVDVGFGTIVEKGKQTVEVQEKTFMVEPALTADVSIIYAKQADTYGNLIYDKSARNTNPLVAMAGNVTIAEVEEIVPAGQLDPECVVTPGVFVDYIVQSKGVDWKWVWELKQDTK